MFELFKKLKKTYSYVRIDECNSLPFLDIREQWAAIIVGDLPFSNERRDEVAHWLCKENCRWMAAWGIDCSKWDDALDEAEIALWPDGAPDDKFIVTTWHNIESLDEVFWFIGTQTSTFDDRAITHFAIVHLSTDDNATQLMQRFAKALKS